MKQKAIIKVQMNCTRCRTKAMRIAATAKCVDTVALEGKDKDKLAIIGEGFDVVLLAKNLKKKLGYATIESVQEIKSKDNKEKPNDRDSSLPYWPTITYQDQRSQYGVVIYDDPVPTLDCSIM